MTFAAAADEEEEKEWTEIGGRTTQLTSNDTQTSCDIYIVGELIVCSSMQRRDPVPPFWNPDLLGLVAKNDFQVRASLKTAKNNWEVGTVLQNRRRQ